MSYPKNPNTKIIINKYYKEGLKEIDIWNYYQKNKNIILNETRFKDLTVFFATDVNTFTVLRRKGDRYLRLNKENYDELISGRTVSIHPNFNKTSSFGIIDIDIEDFELAKQTALNVYNLINDKCDFVNSCLIKYTGKESFHILCYLRREILIDTFRLMMRKFLLESELSRIYTVQHKREKRIPNLDLSSNKQMGGYIALGSLSVLGLKSIIVEPKKLKRFKKEDCIIPIS